MPFSQGERAEKAERVDGGDEGKAGDEETDPPGGVMELEIFGEKRRDAKGDESEFEKEQAVFPPGGGAGGAAEVQSGHEKGKDKDHDGDVAVAFPEDDELVGTVEKVEGMIGPFDFVAGMMGEEPADGEDEEEASGGQSDVPTREVLPEEPVGRSAEKPQCTERMREEHERDEEEGDELEFGAAAPD
jgi:hypothetical protein